MASENGPIHAHATLQIFQLRECQIDFGELCFVE